MNISLTPELERIVKERVKSGLYNNASEVIREALRMMVQQKPFGQYEMWLVSQLQIGIEQARNGEIVPFDMDQVIEETRQKKRDKS